MVEIKNTNTLFQFKIINYQFPDSDDKKYDGNWVIIHINVTNDKLSWSKTDPALLTWEVKELSEWFYKMSKGKKTKWKELRFIEPNIRFKYEKFINNKSKIFIYFGAECLPDNWDRKQECYINFELSNDELSDISKMLENELRKYPIRK